MRPLRALSEVNMFTSMWNHRSRKSDVKLSSIRKNNLNNFWFGTSVVSMNFLKGVDIYKIMYILFRCKI